MPLPDGGNTPWPPKYCEPINAQYATWSAWYSGDMEQLAHMYSGNAGSHDFFGSEAGGWKAAARRAVGAVRRWFWGNRAPHANNRTRLHVPLAGDIAAASADLLFSEPPTFNVPAGDTSKATQARLGELLDDGAHATFLEAAEICAALGGVFLRVVWDPAVRPDRPWITAVHPDVAVPEWSWGDLSAVTFWRELKRDGKVVVRHLERHEPGRILHGVYEGTADELGRVVPLTDYPETAGLAKAQLVNGNEIITGADGLCAVYVPNMKPNRIWRTTPTAAHLGRSDYAGSEALMDALDMTWSSWMRDVDLGKARLIVPREYLQSNGPGRGSTVDLDQEVYEPVNAMAGDGSSMDIREVQFAIRVDEHSRTIADIKATIVQAAGYSGQTFGLVDKAAATATEVAANERRSYITRDRKVRYWRPKLSELTWTLLQVDAKLFASGITPVRPDVEFPDGVSIDPETQARTLRELHTAEAISTEEKVRTLHPDWTDPQVAEEVAAIRSSLGPEVDPTARFGDLAGQPSPGQAPEGV